MLSSHEPLNCLSPGMCKRDLSAHLEMFSVYIIRRAGGLFIWNASMISIHLAISKSRAVWGLGVFSSLNSQRTRQISFVLSPKTTLFSPSGVNYCVLWRLSSLSLNKTSAKLQCCAFWQAFWSSWLLGGWKCHIWNVNLFKGVNMFETLHAAGC